MLYVNYAHMLVLYIVPRSVTLSIDNFK